MVPFIVAVGIVFSAFAGVDCEKRQGVDFDHCISKPEIVHQYPNK